MSDKKNILITGGVGFIGSNLSERLIKEGHNVFSIDDYSFGKKENEFDNIKYIKDDIENLFNKPSEKKFTFKKINYEDN